jgi:hypothetical protein
MWSPWPLVAPRTPARPLIRRHFPYRCASQAIPTRKQTAKARVRCLHFLPADTERTMLKIAITETSSKQRFV